MKSIKIKLYLEFLIYFISFIATLLLLNSLLMEKYFLYQEEKSVFTYYKNVNESYEGFDSLDVDALNGQRFNFGRSIMLFSKDFQMLFDASSGFSNKENEKKTETTAIKKGIPKYNNTEVFYSDLIKEHKSDLDKKRYFGSRINEVSEEVVFWIYKLNNGDYLVVNLKTLQYKKAEKILTGYLILLSIILAVIAGFFLYLFAARITSPVIRLNNIAKKIANQNFEISYEVKTEDEIGKLGNSINLISSKLKKAHKELKDEIKRKDEINNIRKNFISSVSHELKTPIGLIKGCSEVLMYNILKDPVKKEEYFNNIIQETERMDLLVKDMLHISYMESGGFLINKSEFYMDELIEEIYSKYANKFNEKKAEVEKIIIKSSKVVGDKVRLFQVIVNFLENALRHLDSKKHIQIKMEKIESKIKVSIFNSGNNIPDAELDNIWLSFYKTDKAHSRKAGNSGLGLAIVKSIIDSHDGEFGVINEDNGVRFFFTLSSVIA